MDQRLMGGYGVKATGELAAEIGVSKRALWSRAQRLGLSARNCGYSGDWYPDEIETLEALYPILGQDCAPLCNHTRLQVASRAQYLKLHRDYRKRPDPDRERRRVALMVARWCVGHGMHAETVVEECAEWCGCTPAMMRMVLPALLKDEMRRKKSKKKQEGEGQCST
jgi:hypothetical protein